MYKENHKNIHFLQESVRWSFIPITKIGLKYVKTFLMMGLQNLDFIDQPDYC